MEVKYFGTEGVHVIYNVPPVSLLWQHRGILAVRREAFLSRTAAVTGAIGEAVARQGKMAVEQVH